MQLLYMQLQIKQCWILISSRVWFPSSLVLIKHSLISTYKLTKKSREKQIFDQEPTLYTVLHLIKVFQNIVNLLSISIYL